ncbi:MAG: hypothetical protein DBX59_03095 [Bacillota bacterium]|nr:MAG: hypothetical protein DBX59_03095 [Bacillota bacterium]
MKQFVNAMICTEEGIVRANMAFSDQIVSIGAPPDCVFETVKVPENAMILPGFIDIHTPGAGGKDFRDEDCLAACETISEKLAQEGTTSYLSTLGAQTFEQEILSLKEISAFMRSKGKKGARMLGIHLEIRMGRGGLMTPPITGTRQPANTQGKRTATPSTRGIMARLSPPQANIRNPRG